MYFAQNSRARLIGALLSGACALVNGAAQAWEARPDKAVETAKALSVKALGDGWTYKFLEGLTTEVGPRLPGTDNMTHAIKWSQEKLKAAGFDKVYAEPFAMSAWLRGAESAHVISPRMQPLAITALGNSVATPAEGIDAEIALFRSYAELLAAPEGSLRGKIAVVTERMVRMQDGGGYGAAVVIRAVGAVEAGKRGAIAFLIRSIGTDTHRVPHTGAMSSERYNAAKVRIPAAAMSNPDADLLERMAERGPVKLHLLLTPTMVEKSQSANVVAEIRGREKPDEIVLIGGHLDSWDLGTGAIDDGAGVAIAAGAGRLIAALPRHPKRTIRVILFGAEERGFSGDAYARAHEKEAPRMRIMAESDFGARKIMALQVPGGVIESDFTKGLMSAFGPLGIMLSREPARFGGSDFEGLEKIGVPVVSMRQNGLDYFDIHHTPDDTFDKIDSAELAQNVAAYAAFAYLAAEMDVDFRTPAKPAANP